MLTFYRMHIKGTSRGSVCVPLHEAAGLGASGRPCSEKEKATSVHDDASVADGDEFLGQFDRDCGIVVCTCLIWGACWV